MKPPRALEILPGTLELLVMNALCGREAMHGFDILRWLEAATDEELVVEEGSLYPALHRMERRGWLEPEWGVSERGRRAKYYRLTGSGRREVARQESSWRRYVAVVEKVIAAGAST
ncbi:MAG: PadR family transcriptional regulator [Gemmatimonadota bacterium]|nr:PadR family transcriptional regulator [Gemmatimonadota bacterium]